MSIKKYQQGGYAAVGSAMQQNISNPKPKLGPLSKVSSVVGSVVGSVLNSQTDLTKDKNYQLLDKWRQRFGGQVQRFGKDWRLVNSNGKFYLNGVAYDSKGRKRHWDINGNGQFIKDNQLPNSQNETQQNKGRITNSNGGFKTAWTNARNSGLRTFTWNGQSYNTMKRGESSQQYNTWLSKQNPNKSGQTLQQTTQSINPKPIQGTPGYGIHVGNNGVTLQTPNGQTTDITNSHNVSTLINNGNYKAPNLGTLPTNQLDNTPLSNYQELSKHNFNRADIRQGMRDNGLNPYSYSGSDRKQLRTYLNDPTKDNYTQSVSKIIGDGKIQQNMLDKAVQNQTSQYQLTKPQLVNLKFKQGGQMFKYQQGGQAQQANGQQGMEQQAIALVQAAMQGDQQANQTIQQIMQAAQQGDQQALQVAQLLQAIIQKMQGSRKARLGAKLNYFKQASECPEGQEVVYFKKGGEICKVCQGKKMQNGGKSNPVSDFKKKREQEQLKKNYQRNPATKGKSAKEIAEMQKRNRQEASQGKGESPAPVAPWQYKKK